MVKKRARRMNLDLNLISDEGLMTLYRMLKTERGNTRLQISDTHNMQIFLEETNVKVILHERGIEVTF